MAIMRVTPPPTTVRTGTRCPDEGASDTRGRRSGTPRLQIPQPDQGIGGGGEGELPIHQGDAAMPELAQAADGLHPVLGPFAVDQAACLRATGELPWCTTPLRAESLP